jgi:predicted small lipoprotein YifL
MITTRRRFNVVIALLILLALAACGGAPATAPPAATGEAGPATEPADQSPAAGSTPVSEDAAAPTSPPPTATVPFEGEGPWEADFGTADGVTLHGTLFGGEASTGIVLAPNYPGGAASWQPFAGAAAERGYRALAFDLRGHGESGGEADLAAAPDDVAAAVAFLREQGVERIILMGGGEGAMAVILAAASGEDIAGLAAISPMREDDGLAVAEADLAGLNIPSLWIGARTDMEHDAEGMAGQAGGEPEVWIYEGSSLHGTYLFEGIDAPDLTERLLGFAESAAGG